MSVKLVGAWTAGAMLVALYVYATLAAIGNLTGMAAFVGSALGPVPWILLGAQVAVPAIALIASLVIARGRNSGTRLVLLAAGLCTAAAIQLEIMHLIS